MEASIFHVLLTPLIKTSKVGNVKEGNVTGQPGWQGKA